MATHWREVRGQNNNLFNVPITKLKRVSLLQYAQWILWILPGKKKKKIPQKEKCGGGKKKCDLQNYREILKKYIKITITLE